MLLSFDIKSVSCIVLASIIFLLDTSCSHQNDTLSSWQEMKFNNIAKQDDIRVCGVVCVHEIIQSSNKNVTYNEVLTHFPKLKDDRTGFSMAELQQALMSFGIESKGYKLEQISELQELNQLYMIARLKLKDSSYHFVIVNSINKDLINVLDPSIGSLNMTRKKFMSHWTGHTLVIFSPNDIKPTLNPIPHRRFLRFKQD